MSQQYPNDCGPFTFTATFSTKTPGITFNSNIPAVTVYSTAPTTDGKYTVNITGTLYIPGTSTVSMSQSYAFVVTIFSPTVTYIKTAPIASFTYAVNTAAIV